MSRPACMTDAEWWAWSDTNDRLTTTMRVDTPCRDCLDAWHREMLAAGTCNGTPGEPPGGRPPTPGQLGGMSVAELRALRQHLRVALNRARWREYRRRLKVTA